MKYRVSKLAIAIVIVTAAATAPAPFAVAQPAPAAAPAIKRTIALKQDTSIPDREGVMAWVELPIGAAEGKHTHPGDAFGFVLQGTISLEIEGSPAATLKTGDVFHIPQGKVHQATNTGSDAVKLAVVFVTEKGKPLTTPVK